jgi:hypothetical protein
MFYSIFWGFYFDYFNLKVFIDELNRSAFAVTEILKLRGQLIYFSQSSCLDNYCYSMIALFCGFK